MSDTFQLGDLLETRKKLNMDNEARTNVEAAFESIQGFWKVLQFQMASGSQISVISGHPGDVVEFAERNRFLVWTGDQRHPLRYKYRIHEHLVPFGLDLYSVNPYSLNEAIFRIHQDIMVVCIAATDHPRPATFETVPQRQVVVTYERSTEDRKHHNWNRKKRKDT